MGHPLSWYCVAKAKGILWATRPDPYMGSMDITNPQSLNRYAYVSNNPINAFDPSGLCGNAQCGQPGTKESDFDDCTMTLDGGGALPCSEFQNSGLVGKDDADWQCPAHTDCSNAESHVNDPGIYLSKPNPGFQLEFNCVGTSIFNFDCYPSPYTLTWIASAYTFSKPPTSPNDASTGWDVALDHPEIFNNNKTWSYAAQVADPRTITLFYVVSAAPGAATNATAIGASITATFNETVIVSDSYGLPASRFIANMAWKYGPGIGTILGQANRNIHQCGHPWAC